AKHVIDIESIHSLSGQAEGLAESLTEDAHRRDDGNIPATRGASSRQRGDGCAVTPFAHDID
ncbi:MAG: hypothetical protein ACTH7C_12005, partial [Cobetia marina]